MFERLRAAINAALDAATPPPNLREMAGQMHQAVVELQSTVMKQRQDYLATQQQLQAERQARDDAERRGSLAAGIQDKETVEVAQRFVAKHNERIGVLEQKLAALTAELGLSERELADMKAQLKRVEHERPAAAAAWRSVESAGGTRPETDLNDDLMKNQLDRAERDAQAAEQLKELKRKMGK